MTDHPADTELGGKDPNEVINDGLGKLYKPKKRKAKDVLAKALAYAWSASRNPSGLRVRISEETRPAREEAQTTLKDDLLAIVGEDERKGWYGYDRDTGRRVHHTSSVAIARNDQRAELRKAIRNYFGEDV